MGVVWKEVQLERQEEQGEAEAVDGKMIDVDMDIHIHNEEQLKSVVLLKRGDAFLCQDSEYYKEVKML